MADGGMPSSSRILKRPHFKPVNAARLRDYKIQRTPHKDTSAFIKTHHYAKGCSHTSTESFGLFRGNVLVGAALWLPPTRRAAESVDPFDWKQVLSLSRLAVAPGEPQNAASLFIGAMMRSLNEEKRWTCLLTFADESQGHEGTIYKATNWSYLGRTKPTPRWLDSEGCQVATLSTKTRKVAQMRALGYRVEGKYAKHKFASLTRIGLAQCFIRMGLAIQRNYDQCSANPKAEVKP